MKDICKFLWLFCVLAAAVFYPAIPAVAQENYYNSSLQKAERAAAENPEAGKNAADAETPAAAPEAAVANSFTVTSIQKCYAQLSREDALDIQQNYTKPYQECQRRLALKLKKEQSLKAGSAKETQPEKSGGFYSVSQPRDKAKKDEKGTEARKPPFLQEKAPLK